MTSVCPKCTRKIPSDAPRGLCPHCLLESVWDGGEKEYTSDADDIYEESRYGQQKEFARGGMGRILLARDNWIGREVLFKELLPGLVEPGSEPDEEDEAFSGTGELRSRFLHEAQVTGQLEHPTIIPIYEIGKQDNGNAYYTMRYVRGQTLAERLAECSGLNERLAFLPNFVDVCHGIAYAHSKRVIHRDIKPRNILIGEFSETVIIDWGLAKHLDEIQAEELQDEDSGASNRLSTSSDYENTLPGELMGSPLYMSPEQVVALSGSIDERSDVYALGVVLYEILSARRPFENEELSVVFEQIKSKEPKPLRILDRHIPKELETICLKALSKNRDKRYDSALELAEDIARFQSGAVVDAYEYSPVEKLGRVYSSNKGLINTLFACVAILIVVLITSFKSVQEARDDAIVARDQEIVARTDADAERYLALLSLAGHQVGSEEIDQAMETLLSVSPTDRNWEWGYLYNVCTQGERITTGFTQIEVSPDGAYMAGAGPRKPLSIWRLDGMQLERVVDDSGIQVNTLLFHTSSSSIITGYHDGSIRIWESGTGALLSSVSAGTSPVAAISQTGDGTRFASVTSTGEISVWDMGQLSPKLVAQMDAATDWTAANRELTTGDADISLSLNNAGDLLVASVREWSAHEGITSVWGLDSERNFQFKSSNLRMFPQRDLLLSTRDGAVFVLDLTQDTPKETRLFIESQDIEDVDITGDGKWIGGLTVSGEVYGWRSANLKMQPIHLAAHVSGKNENRIVSVGDRHFALATNAGPFRLLLPSNPSDIKEFRGHLGPATFIRLDPNQSRIFTSGIDQSIRLWSLNEPAPVQTIHSFPDWATDLAQAPNADVLLASGLGSALMSIDGHTLAAEELIPSQGESGGRLTALSSDGRFVLKSVNPKFLRIYEIDTLAPVSEISGHSQNITTAEFSDDSTRVLTASWDGSVRVWERDSGKELVEKLDHGSTSVYVAHWMDKGQRIITGSSNGIITIWDSNTGQEILSTAAHSDSVFAILELASRGVIVTGSDDGRISIWDRETLEFRHHLATDGSSARTLVLSPDETRLFSGHSDGDIKVWNTKSWREIATLQGHRYKVNDLKFVQDGRALISVGDDGNVRAWKAMFPPLDSSS